MSDPKITKIENIYFAHQIENMGTDYNGFNQVYQKGATLPMTQCVVRIHTSMGITGECLGRPVPENVARYLLGRDPFARERVCPRADVQRYQTRSAPLGSHRHLRR